MSDWVRKAEDPAPAAGPEQQNLKELDRQRAPAPANPTGQPEPPKPLPIGDILKLLEGAGKALIDAGLDLEKGSSGVQKITTMGGSAEGERKIIELASELTRKISAAQQQVKELAAEVASFRESVTSAAPAARGSKGWWLKK